MYAKLQRKLTENVFVCFKMVYISPLTLTETKYRNDCICTVHVVRSLNC